MSCFQDKKNDAGARLGRSGAASEPAAPMLVDQAAMQSRIAGVIASKPSWRCTRMSSKLLMTSIYRKMVTDPEVVARSRL